MIQSMNITLAFVSQWDLRLHEWIAGLGSPVEGFVRLAVAAVMGGLVGIEREVRGRQAGFRTYLLVCVGSALVMLVSAQVALVPWPAHGPGVNVNVDPARIAYGVMTGIGFLGAGLIVHEKGAVHGLTTAAALWCVAAMGLAIGFGMYSTSLFTTLLMLGALWILDYVEELIPKQHFRTITIRTKWGPECVPNTILRFKTDGLWVTEAYFERHEDMKFADIQLRIGFIKRDRYYAFERKIEADPDYELMAAREV
jgi:putative Mg2+ transporter-C (MgtC) family protein